MEMGMEARTDTIRDETHTSPHPHPLVTYWWCAVVLCAACRVLLITCGMVVLVRVLVCCPYDVRCAACGTCRCAAYMFCPP